MLILQHVLCTMKEIVHPSTRLIAATMYPDAVRAYTGHREYSHFEKSANGDFSYYMAYPNDLHTDGATIKAAIDATKQDISLVCACAVGEKTDMQAFLLNNKDLDVELKRGIAYHLLQDMAFDDFIRDVIDCSGKYNDTFSFQGKIMNGAEVRALINQISQHGMYVLARDLYERKGLVINQTWLQNHLRPIMEKEFSADLMTKTYKYMVIEPRIEELISARDWSELDKGPVSLQAYEDLYADVGRRMKDYQ